MVEMIANVPELSVAGPVAKTVVLLVLVTVWLLAVPWVDRDARKVLRMIKSAKMWDAAVLGAGTLGVLAWLVMPFYLLGMLFYLVLAGGVVVAYAAFRDGKVPSPEDRVLNVRRLLGSLKRERHETIEVVTKVTIYDNSERLVRLPASTEGADELVQAYNLTQELLYDMVWRRASEATIVPVGDKTRVLHAIDGVTMERPALPLAMSESIIQFLKQISGMDPAERRQPQTGTISVDLGKGRSDMEITVAGTTTGQRITFRIAQEVARTRLAELGMPEDMLADVRKLAKAENGLFIISGLRGSGVTSTLYSLLRERDAFIQNVITLEASRAVELENITQQPYEDDAMLPKVLTAVVKRGLDVLMVDNCPDTPTARLIAQVAAKRPILLGMQASDSFVALAKWVKLCGDAATAVRILHGVMCQSLFRQLCAECREAYRPDPQRLAKLNLSAEKIENFYRPPEPGEGEKGDLRLCPACQGSGYRGRTAAFELLLLNNDIRQLIIERATVAQIRSACRKNKMLYLQEQALRKVIDGTTSIQEVIRVTQQAKS